MESGDSYQAEVLAQVAGIVRDMEKIAQEEQQAEPGTFSLASMAIQDEKFLLMQRFLQLFNACSHDPTQQQDVIRAVQESALSQHDKIALCPMLGSEGEKL